MGVTPHAATSTLRKVHEYIITQMDSIIARTRWHLQHTLPKVGHVT